MDGQRGRVDALLPTARDELPVELAALGGDVVGALNGLLRYSYYGKYTSALYSYSEEGVQEYDAKGLVDAEIGWRPFGGTLKLSLGGRNLFDVYPDRMSAANGFDIFPYPPASPFGYNGRYLYTRLEWAGQ